MKRLKKGKNDIEIKKRIKWLRDITSEFSLDEVFHKEHECLLRFKRDQETMIDVFYTTMSVCRFIPTDEGFKQNWKKIKSEDEFIELL